MKCAAYILALCLYLVISREAYSQNYQIKQLDFYGDEVTLTLDSSLSVPFDKLLDQTTVKDFLQKINASNYQPVVNALLNYKKEHKPDDWLYYQLIRKTAQHLSPKAENYIRYTLYKWFLLTKSGYDAFLCTAGEQILFYVQSDENIYNIPFRLKNGKQYVCLNYHDYGNIDFEKTVFSEIDIKIPQAKNSFSYKLTRLPDFKENDYSSKELLFTYNDVKYRFNIKLNKEVKNIFTNYPVVDYANYFNAPLSKETYSTLIPALKKNIRGMSTRNGVDYLMNFTRYALSFEADAAHFGQEKRLTPEQTLLYEKSDCEDRAALFFYLVKEIYDLPMILLVYPNHVTTAIRFNKPIGKTILYNGHRYSVCEPTPQKENLLVGQLLPELHNVSYEVGFAYFPQYLN